MADFIHSREYLSIGDAFILNCDTQCNFLLLDDNNFSRYRRGDSCEYFGGFFERFPAQINAPRTGYWNAVVDLGGNRATIQYEIQVLKR